MAKTTGNVLGDQSGKIGKVVGRVVEGQQMYSAYSKGGRNPRTPKQVAHRARFAVAVELGRAMKGVLNVGLRNVAAKRKLQSAFNVFVHENMRNISYDPETEVAKANFVDIMLADGETPSVEFGTLSLAETLKVTVPYSSREEPGAYDEDSVYAVVYAPELGYCVMGIGTRAGTSVSITVPPTWEGTTVHVWGFVRTKVSEPTLVEAYGIRLKPYECSKSRYLGSGTIAGA